MEKIDILFTVMVSAQGITLSIMYLLWGTTEKVREEVKDIDRRLCRIEGALSSKDCCMLKDSNQMKKSE